MAGEVTNDDLQVGQPYVTGARVLADVTRRPTEDDPNPSVKVYVQKFRRRKNYRRLRGHRQPYVEVQVKHILLGGQEAPAYLFRPQGEQTLLMGSAGVPGRSPQ